MVRMKIRMLSKEIERLDSLRVKGHRTMERRDLQVV